MSFLINTPRAGLQSELNAFLDHALAPGDTSTLSKSALCQARSELDPAALRALVAHSGGLLAEHLPTAQWHQRRVVALDSTVLRVPNVPECANHFGGMTTGCGKFRPLARASALWDVARGCVVDAVLGGFADDDRSLAIHHLDALTPQDMLVMDRGYPSRDWLRALQQRHIGFCARICAQRWRAVAHFARSGHNDALMDLGTPQQPLRLRLVRIILPNGTLLYLVTNLLDDTIKPNDFAELYRSRWRIEEAFKLIKARLQVENWSGLLPHTVLQDFFATLVRLNCAAALTAELLPESPSALAIPNENPAGWRIKPNATLLLKALRHHLPRLLLDIDRAGTIEKLIRRLTSSTNYEQTRPNRKAPRAEGVRIAGFHTAYKAA